MLAGQSVHSEGVLTVLERRGDGAGIVSPRLLDLFIVELCIVTCGPLQNCVQHTQKETAAANWKAERGSHVACQSVSL